MFQNSHVPLNTRLAHLQLQLRLVLVAAKQLPFSLASTGTGSHLLNPDATRISAYPDASGSALTANTVLAGVYHCSSLSSSHPQSLVMAYGAAHTSRLPQKSRTLTVTRPGRSGRSASSPT